MEGEISSIFQFSIIEIMEEAHTPSFCLANPRQWQNEACAFDLEISLLF